MGWLGCCLPNGKLAGVCFGTRLTVTMRGVHRSIYGRDATDMKKTVLLGFGTEQLGFQPSPSVGLIHSPWWLPSGITAWVVAFLADFSVHVICL